jgi:hypothetical protein
MGGRLWRRDADEGRAIIGGRVALAEVIRLDLGAIASQTFLWSLVSYDISLALRKGMSTYPVDLVQVVRFQHDTADDAGARRGLHFDLGGPEKEVKVGLDRRGVALFGDSELGPVGAVRHASAHRVPGRRGALGEVGVGILTVETGIARAICPLISSGSSRPTASCTGFTYCSATWGCRWCRSGPH